MGMERFNESGLGVFLTRRERDLRGLGRLRYEKLFIPPIILY
jgi:hypothetical protein